MARPILLVKFNTRVYTPDQVLQMKDVVFNKTKSDYITIFMSSDNVIDISFEVINEDGSSTNKEIFYDYRKMLENSILK